MAQSDSSPTETSIVVAVVRDLRDLGRWLESSTIVRTYRRFSTKLGTAASNSALSHLVALLGAWIRASYLYRWLTKEPEPDVVVIDLRETYTVGPVIALLDRLAPFVGRMWRGSRASQLVETLQTSAKRRWFEKSRTLQLLAAALEPPEPPSEDDRN